MNVTCPSVVRTYNKSMGGVDLLDSLTAPYLTKLRSKKWYHMIVFHMMDFTLINAWLLYRRDCRDCSIPQREVQSLLQFKSEVASCLLYGAEDENGKNPPNMLRKTWLGRGAVTSAPVPPAAVRWDNTDHWPAVMNKKGRCKYPGWTGIVRVQCTKCETYLCFTVERNYFMFPQAIRQRRQHEDTQVSWKTSIE